MNHYMNYRKWKLAHIRRDIPDPLEFPETPHGEPHPQDNFYSGENDFRQRDPSGYLLRVRRGPKGITISGSNADYGDDNSPDVRITVAPELVKHSLNLLHHMFNTHDKILPYDAPFQIKHSPINHPPDSDYAGHHTTERTFTDEDVEEGEDNIIPGTTRRYSHSAGVINSPRELLTQLSNLFSNTLLNHLNHHTEDIVHPGRDYILDNLENNSTLPLSDNIMKDRAKVDPVEREKARINQEIAEAHATILHDYMNHHLQDLKSNLPYLDFLRDSTKSHPAVKELIAELLQGKHSRGEAQ